MSELFRSAIDFPGGSDGKASAYNAGDPGSIPGLERSLGEGNGNPLQYSCLENPMDGGAWWATSPWGRKESDTTVQLHFLSLYRLVEKKNRIQGLGKRKKTQKNLHINGNYF